MFNLIRKVAVVFCAIYGGSINFLPELQGLWCKARELGVTGEDCRKALSDVRVTEYPGLVETGTIFSFYPLNFDQIMASVDKSAFLKEIYCKADQLRSYTESLDKITEPYEPKYYNSTLSDNDIRIFRYAYYQYYRIYITYLALGWIDKDFDKLEIGDLKQSTEYSEDLYKKMFDPSENCDPLSATFIELRSGAKRDFLAPNAVLRNLTRICLNQKSKRFFVYCGNREQIGKASGLNVDISFNRIKLSDFINIIRCCMEDDVDITLVDPILCDWSFNPPSDVPGSSFAEEFTAKLSEEISEDRKQEIGAEVDGFFANGMPYVTDFLPFLKPSAGSWEERIAQMIAIIPEKVAYLKAIAARATVKSGDQVDTEYLKLYYLLVITDIVYRMLLAPNKQETRNLPQSILPTDHDNVLFKIIGGSHDRFDIGKIVANAVKLTGSTMQITKMPGMNQYIISKDSDVDLSGGYVNPQSVINAINGCIAQKDNISMNVYVISDSAPITDALTEQTPPEQIPTSPTPHEQHAESPLPQQSPTSPATPPTETSQTRSCWTQIISGLSSIWQSIVWFFKKVIYWITCGSCFNEG